MEALFNKTVLEKIGTKILKRRESVAVAESVTCGLLQFSFSNIPDASKFLQGGVTAFNIGQKYKHLEVEPLHAASVNCVSQKVADEMCLQVSVSYCSDWAIAITGYASPAPEGDNKLFAYYAISYRGKIKARGKMTSTKTEPSDVQLYYTNQILLAYSKLL